jgi:hypothetical protein
MGMAWYKFYVYAYLPLGVIGYVLALTNTSFDFSNFHIRAMSYPPEIPVLIFFVVAVITIALNFILIFGLHFKKLWAWYLNLFSLAMFPIVYGLYYFTNLPTYLCSVLLSAALWFIPNFAYFERRKNMFG